MSETYTTEAAPSKSEAESNSTSPSAPWNYTSTAPHIGTRTNELTDIASPSHSDKSNASSSKSDALTSNLASSEGPTDDVTSDITGNAARLTSDRLYSRATRDVSSYSDSAPETGSSESAGDQTASRLSSDGLSSGISSQPASTGSIGYNSTSTTAQDISSSGGVLEKSTIDISTSVELTSDHSKARATRDISSKSDPFSSAPASSGSTSDHSMSRSTRDISRESDAATNGTQSSISSERPSISTEVPSTTTDDVDTTEVTEASTSVATSDDKTTTAFIDTTTTHKVSTVSAGATTVKQTDKVITTGGENGAATTTASPEVSSQQKTMSTESGVPSTSTQISKTTNYTSTSGIDETSGMSEDAKSAKTTDSLGTTTFPETSGKTKASASTPSVTTTASYISRSSLETKVTSSDVSTTARETQSPSARKTTLGEYSSSGPLIATTYIYKETPQKSTESHTPSTLSTSTPGSVVISSTSARLSSSSNLPEMTTGSVGGPPGKPGAQNVVPIAVGASVGVIGIVVVAVLIFILLRRKFKKPLARSDSAEMFDDLKDFKISTAGAQDPKGGQTTTNTAFMPPKTYFETNTSTEDLDKTEDKQEGQNGAVQNEDENIPWRNKKGRTPFANIESRASTGLILLDGKDDQVVAGNVYDKDYYTTGTFGPEESSAQPTNSSNL